MRSYLPTSVRQYFSNFSLSLFMSKENKVPVGLFLGLCSVILYLPANHFHFFTPRLLSFHWVDYVVPFLPHTVWLYISEYVYFIVIYCTCKDMINLNKYFYSFLALQTTSVFIFWIWPTTYPRQNYPLPQDLDFITYFVFNSLRATDTPANCCPSLHVSAVYLSSFLFLDEQRKKFLFFFIWGTGIALSTLTTKQHYLIDVISGLIMAVSFYFFFHKWIQYKPAKK